MSDDLNNLDKDIEAKLVAKYRKILLHMGADLPISALCLPKKIENVLFKSGIERAYDLIHADLRSISGLGDRGIEIIAARMDELFSITI